MIMNLDNLTENDILHKPVPLTQLLENSVYYPFSWTDGRPIRLANTLFRRQFHEVNSFVYCDFFMDEQRCMQEMDTLCGYHPIAIRKLTPREYQVKDFKVELSSNDEGHYFTTCCGHDDSDYPKQFAIWCVLERNQTKDSLHGPMRLSILYFGGRNNEALAVYQQLYMMRHISPICVCFIQCFTGMSGNWGGSPLRPDGSWARMFRRHKDVVPEWLMVGDYKDIHGCIHLRSTSYLGVRMVAYGNDIFIKDEDCFSIESSLYRDVKVLEHNGRKYLKLKCSHQLSECVYAIDPSCKYDVKTLVDNLIITDRESKPGDILNEFLGFKKPTYTYYNGQVYPELDLSVRDRSLNDSKQVADAIRVVDGVYDWVILRNEHSYTPLMESYLQTAKWFLDGKSEYEECDRLLRHLNLFCTKLPQSQLNY